MGVFLMLKIIMVKGRTLKKASDLEAQKQNVVSSKQTIGKQNVVSSKQTIGKQNVDPLQLGFGEQNVVPSESKLGEQNVAPLELRPEEQSVTSSELRIDESSNLCGLELAVVTICNSNDEIILNTNWEFQSKNGGLDCFRIYIH
jgi:hypothetical protein